METEPKNLSSVCHPFQRSGIVPISDFESFQWRKLFAFLEEQQAGFLKFEPRFRSPEYIWPRDPLHTWSRAWEYPYAYYHLKKWIEKTRATKPLHIIDMGSGVTFFPFSIARLGCEVTCTDNDPVAGKDIKRASSVVPHGPGSVNFKLCGTGPLPFAAEEADAVYCISVLEHIPQSQNAISEIARILKPGGLFVLTIDLDLRGDSEIGVQQYRSLIATLRTHFDYVFPDTTIHPAEALDTRTGPFPIFCHTGVLRYRFLIREKLRELLGRKPRLLLSHLLTVQGFVLRRK